MRRLLVLLGIITLGVNVASAAVAVHRDLPYGLPILDRTGDPADVQHDFYFRLGTALTPPMWVMAIMAVAIVLASSSGGTGRFGAFLLVLVAALTIAWISAQPYARNRLSRDNLDGVESSLLIANIALCSLVVLLGIVTVFTQRTDRYR